MNAGEPGQHVGLIIVTLASTIALITDSVIGIHNNLYGEAWRQLRSTAVAIVMAASMQCKGYKLLPFVSPGSWLVRIA